MATQSRNLYDEDQINAIRREYGVPEIAESMAAAIEETKDTVVKVATTVAEGAAVPFRAAGRDILVLLLGFILGVASVTFGHFI